MKNKNKKIIKKQSVYRKKIIAKNKIKQNKNRIKG